MAIRKDGRMPNSGIGATSNFQRFSARRRKMIPSGFAPPKAPTTQSPPVAGFPAPEGAPPNFFPTSPVMEAGRRGLDDQYAQQRMAIMNQLNLIRPQVRQQAARMDTDQAFDTNTLQERLAGRNMLQGNGEMSGVYNQLYNRDIQIPYGRSRQDLATWAAQNFAGLRGQQGENELNYNQQLAEIMLNNAAWLAQNMPMNIPTSPAGTPGGGIDTSQTSRRLRKFIPQNPV